MDKEKRVEEEKTRRLSNRKPASMAGVAVPLQADLDRYGIATEVFRRFGEEGDQWLGDLAKFYSDCAADDPVFGSAYRKVLQRTEAVLYAFAEQKRKREALTEKSSRT